MIRFQSFRVHKTDDKITSEDLTHICEIVQSLSHVWLFANQWTVAPCLLWPWDFLGKNIEVGCHALLQGDFPDPGIEHVFPECPALAGRFFTTEPPGKYYIIGSCCSVAKLCPTLCDSVDCSMTGYFVLHCLIEFAQIYVHWVSDTI